MRVFSDEGVRLDVITGTLPAVGVRDKLTVAQLTAAGVVELADYAVVGSTDFVQTASDTNDERRYSDRGKVSIPTLKNANGKLTIYRDRDEVTLALTEDDPVQYFDDRQTVLVLKRKGVSSDTPWAVGQDYEFFLFRSDYVATPGDGDGSFEKAEVGMNFQGHCGFGVVAAA